ncbi:hypothetical protein D3C77_546910 [compost metagenome]
MPPPQFHLQNDAATDAVSMLSLDQQDGHTGRVRWHGVVTRDTDEQHLQAGRREYFQIDRSWIAENRGREVLINYSLYRGNNERFRFSRVLRLRL